MVDAAQGTIPVTPTTVWLYKKYNICERGCQDRGRQRKSPTHTASTQPLWLDPLPYSGIPKKQNPDPFKAQL